MKTSFERLIGTNLMVGTYLQLSTISGMKREDAEEITGATPSSHTPLDAASSQSQISHPSSPHRMESMVNIPRTLV